MDKVAFTYYYCQVRDEFHRAELPDGLQNQTPNPSGLIITDLLNYVLEKNIAIDQVLKNVDLAQFLPKSKSKYKKHIIKLQSHSIVDNLLQSSISTGGNIDVVKLEFIRGLVGKPSAMLAECTCETYSIKLHS